MINRQLNRNQWKRVYRKLRARLHLLSGQSLHAQDMAMLRSIHAELAAPMLTPVTVTEGGVVEVPYGLAQEQATLRQVEAIAAKEASRYLTFNGAGSLGDE